MVRKMKILSLSMKLSTLETVHLSVAVPNYGICENINSLKELAQMPQWSEERPRRVATGFTYLGPKFMEENGIKHVTFSTADGALEAAPAMGIADAILDLVSSGTTLKENNLKEIEGGVCAGKPGCTSGKQKSIDRGKRSVKHSTRDSRETGGPSEGRRAIHCCCKHGNTAQEVAGRVLSQPSLSGLQGPTISPAYCTQDGKVSIDYYAIVICVPKKGSIRVYEATKSGSEAAGY